MTKLKRLGRAGYTLTELMMVVAIIGILALVGPTMMINMQNFFLMTSARYEIQRDARTSLDLMNRFIRQAYQTSIVIDTPAGQGPYSHITFSLPDGRVMQFKQNGSKLLQVVTDTAGTHTTTLTTNLIYIAFTFPHTDDTSIVSVSVTMGKQIQLGRRKVLELTIQKVRVMN